MKLLWYRLEPNAETNYYSPSGQAYIFSGNVVYVGDAAQFEWFDSISGKEFNANALRILTGEIHSTNRMIKLKAEINDGGKIVRGPVEQELERVYNYSMAKSPLEVLMFGALEPSNNYELFLEITYYSCGENLELTYSQTYPFKVLP